MKHALALSVLGAFVVLVVILALEGSSQNHTTNSNSSTIMTDTTMRLTSPAFEDGGEVPTEYTCDGSNTNPPLAIENVSEQATSLALIVEDPDVPPEIREDQTFDHWIVFNISPEKRDIQSGAGIDGTAGQNTAGATGYTGPCPPTQFEPTEHRYIFTLYALDTTLDLKEGATKQEVIDAMEDHIIEQATLTGRYDRAEDE